MTGSEEFERFYRSTTKQAFAFALGLSRDGYRQDAEDVTQEAFVALFRWWQERSTVSDDQARAYLFGTLRKQCSQVARGDRSRRRLIEQLTPGMRDHIFHVDDSALHGDARGLLRRLPRQQRRIVYLHLVEGYTLADAAEAIGIAPSTARNHFKRARKILKDGLDGGTTGTPEEI